LFAQSAEPFPSLFAISFDGFKWELHDHLVQDLRPEMHVGDIPYK